MIPPTIAAAPRGRMDTPTGTRKDSAGRFENN
jgi:hypothetical protein